jgi:hypothetical protein
LTSRTGASRRSSVERRSSSQMVVAAVTHPTGADVAAGVNSTPAAVRFTCTASVEPNATGVAARLLGPSLVILYGGAGAWA